MRTALIVLLLLVGAGLAWYATRDDESPVRQRVERESASEAPPATEPAKAPEPAPAYRMVGTVLGDAPLAGVRVRADWGTGAAQGETDEKGSYSFAVPKPDKFRIAHLRAEAPDGRVGFGMGWVKPDETESKAEPITLKPGANVLLRTIGFDGTPVPNAKIRILELVTYPGLGNRKLPRVVQDTQSDAKGRLELRLPVAEFRVWASAPGFGRAVQEFKLGDDTKEIALELPAERQLKVLVRDKATQEPVQGASIYTVIRHRDYGNPASVTDEFGAARVLGVNPADTIRLLVLPPGEERPPPGPGRFQARKVPQDEDELVVLIEMPRTITWPVRDGAIKAPANGTKITIKSDPGALVKFKDIEGVMDGGRLVVRYCPAGHFHGFAHAPGGIAARLFCKAGETDGMETEFKTVCNIDLLIRNRDGTPAEGTKIAIFNQGNNMMLEVTTDAAGKARMEALFGELAELKLMWGQYSLPRAELGTVDLRRGDLSIDFTLPLRRAVEFQVKLGGKPGLPVGYRIWIGRRPLEDLEVDNDAGTFKATTVLPKPGAELTVAFTVPGYRTGTAKLKVPAGDGPLRHTFDLLPGLDLRVVNNGEPDFEPSLELQHFQEGFWQTVDGPRMFQRRQRKPFKGGFIFVGLEPGRYRMRDTRQHTVLDETELAPGGANTLTLDYAGVRRVKGRVELPEGYEFNEVRIGWVGAPEVHSAFDRGGVRVDRKTGEFEMFTMAGKPVEIVATHPLLRGEPVTVDGAREGLVLKLATGPTLRFRIPVVSWQPIRVRLYESGSFDHVAFTAVAKLKEKEWSLGGMPEGRYTLFIDVPSSVPLIRHDFVVKAGDTDLGELPMTKGATVRIRVLVNKPFAVPRIYAFAWALGAPKYNCSINSGGEELVELTGLLPGKYRLTFGSNAGMSAARNDETVEIGPDGLDRTLDLREQR